MNETGNTFFNSPNVLLHRLEISRRVLSTTLIDRLNGGPKQLTILLAWQLALFYLNYFSCWWLVSTSFPSRLLLLTFFNCFFPLCHRDSFVGQNRRMTEMQYDVSLSCYALYCFLCPTSEYVSPARGNRTMEDRLMECVRRVRANLPCCTDTEDGENEDFISFIKV